ncbi:MAG: murein hydrolase activator EnvC family protein [Woeseiaceae bacterium]
MIFRLTYCLVPLLLFQAQAVLAQDDGVARVKERELEQVRERISELKSRMDERAAERDRITANLEDAEVSIAERRLQLEELERQRSASETKIVELERRIDRSQGELELETVQLGAEVRAAYTSGRQERLKLLLNQHDPAELGRLMAYYRYLSRHRGQNIETVNAHLDELADLHEQGASERDRLAGLASAREAELARLDEAQEKRQQLIASVKAKIAEDGSEIERLAAEEKDLTRLIAELTSILSDYPITSDAPFTDLKGALTWPVVGTLLHDFGQPRAGGGIKWNGVVLAAPRGREVRAVYHGRVVFADWLAGLGLLVIVDHGEGYMTLYGYNETTLKSAGDWVAPGDVIATVGDSGGRQLSGLYFEIRKGAVPVDPHSWFTRKPRPGG